MAETKRTEAIIVAENQLSPRTTKVNTDKEAAIHSKMAIGAINKEASKPNNTDLTLKPIRIGKAD